MKFEILGYTINISKELQEQKLPKDLEEAIAVIEKYGQKVRSSEAQKKAAANATKKRIETARIKIENAINILRLENKKITEYAISKESGCSINTVKKYRDFIEQNK